MTIKSAGYLDKSGGFVAHPFAASIKTIQQPLFPKGRKYKQIVQMERNEVNLGWEAKKSSFSHHCHDDFSPRSHGNKPSLSYFSSFISISWYFKPLSSSERNCKKLPAKDHRQKFISNTLAIFRDIDILRNHGIVFLEMINKFTMNVHRVYGEIIEENNLLYTECRHHYSTIKKQGRNPYWVTLILQLIYSLYEL